MAASVHVRDFIKRRRIKGCQLEASVWLSTDSVFFIEWIDGNGARFEMEHACVSFDSMKAAFDIAFRMASRLAEGPPTSEVDFPAQLRDLRAEQITRNNLAAVQSSATFD